MEDVSVRGGEVANNGHSQEGHSPDLLCCCATVLLCHCAAVLLFVYAVLLCAVAILLFGFTACAALCCFVLCCCTSICCELLYAHMNDVGLTPLPLQRSPVGEVEVTVVGVPPSLTLGQRVTVQVVGGH